MTFKQDFIKTALVAAAVSLGLTIFAIAEPQRLLGEGGAYIWSEAEVTIHGLFPLNDGTQVMQTYSARRAEDAVMHIYMQISDINGDVAFDPPLQLSEDGLISNAGGAVTDREGNIFLVWISAEPDDLDNSTLYAQKYNPNGEPLWGDNPLQVRVFNENPTAYRQPRLLPDENGGFYFLTSNRFAAIDENGAIRLIWDWHDSRPDPDFNLHAHPAIPPTIITDEIGGFWYCVNVEGHKLWNHVSYEGEVLWDAPESFDREGLPGEEDEDLMMFAGYEGGGLCEYYTGHSNLFFAVNGEGQIRRGGFIHEVDRVDEWIPAISSSNYFRQTNGVIVLPMSNNLANYERRVMVMAYNPQDNSLPYGENGIIIRHTFEDRSAAKGGSFAENNDGEIYYTLGGPGIGSEVYKISENGQMLWDEPAWIERIAPNMMAPAVDDGFWISGFTYGASLDYPDLLNVYNEDAEPLVEEFIETGVPRRDKVLCSHLWIHPDGNYRMINPQNLTGIKVMTIDPDGLVIGNPEGQMAVPMREKKQFWDSFGTEDGIIYIWKGYSSDIPDNAYSMTLAGFNFDGELEWSATHIDSTSGPAVQSRQFELSPDGENLLVTNILWEREERVHFRKIFNFSTENGELIWQQDTHINGSSSQSEISNRSFYNGEAIYSVYVDSEVFNDTLCVYRLDLNGEMVWETPFKEFIGSNTRILGSIPRDDGGIWLVKYGETEDGLEVWMDALDEEGQEFVERHYFYSEAMEIERSYMRSRYPVFELVSQRDNIWIIPYQDIQFGVQGLTQDGERLLGGHGFLPEAIIANRDDDDFWGIPDGEGGLWLKWRQDGTWLTHFNSEGEFVDGWDENGFNVWGDGILPAEKDNYPLSGSELAILGFRYGIHEGYYLQHISDPEPDSAYETKPASPFEFRITEVFPNPFNATTIISFELPYVQQISLRVYDMTGRMITILANGQFNAGRHCVIFDENKLPGGIYIARLESKDKTHAVKMTLLK